jgi:hypothetical protein
MGKKKRSTLRSRRNGPDNTAALAANEAHRQEIRKKWKRVAPFGEADEMALRMADDKRARQAARQAKGMRPHAGG